MAPSRGLMGTSPKTEARPLATERLVMVDWPW